MAQLAKPVEPFGEVNVYKKADGSIDIVATILMVPDIEGARTGLALDASASMKKMYGVSGLVGGRFAAAASLPNVVELAARAMAAFLARFASNGKCSLAYWACKPDGTGVEPIAEVDDEEARRLVIAGPRQLPWGRGTKLLPPIRYFIETVFKDAPWAICVFVTDGVIEDLAEVKAYCLAFANQIASGQRSFVKLVLIGVGNEVNESQMEELDDMFLDSGLKDAEGNAIDLWDHKLASEMQKIEEIFAEIVTEDTIVFSGGRVLNQAGKVCTDYAGGVPALLRFTLPPGSTAFTLEYSGGQVTQDIRAGLPRDS